MASSRMATNATAVPGSSTSVVSANATSTMTVVRLASSSSHVRAPVSCRIRRCPKVTRVNTTSATALPMEAIALRSKETARTIAPAAVTRMPMGARPPTRRPIRGGNWPIVAICSGETCRRVQPRVGRAGGGEERRDRHQPVAGRTEHRLGSDGECGAPRVDHLVDGQRPEHAERDRDVHDRRDAERQVDRPGQLAVRVGEVLGREGDDTEAEEGEEGQRDAGHDVAQRGIPREREQVEVQVRQRRDREHDEDPDDDHDHHGLGTGDDLRARMFSAAITSRISTANGFTQSALSATASLA